MRWRHAGKVCPQDTRGRGHQRAGYNTIMATSHRRGTTGWHASSGAGMKETFRTGMQGVHAYAIDGTMG